MFEIRDSDDEFNMEIEDVPEVKESSWYILLPKYNGQYFLIPVLDHIL